MRVCFVALPPLPPPTDDRCSEEEVVARTTTTVVPGALLSTIAASYESFSKRCEETLSRSIMATSMTKDPDFGGIPPSIAITTIEYLPKDTDQLAQVLA